MNGSVLECRGLFKYYGKTPALTDVNLTLNQGRITGLLGPNGSGKTTFIKILNGLLTPSDGEVFICGEHIGTETKKIVSYLPDSVCIPQWMKIWEIINFYNSFFEDFDSTKAYDMLKNLRLEQNDRFKNLSKGNKEKVQLILTMSRRAKLYLLDEPMGGVDPATREYILNTIISNYSENSSVLISTHLIADIEKVLDDVVFIDKGQIVLRQSVDDIRERENKSVDALFREVFRC